MPAGRPTDYREEYCDTVVKCGREGMSRAEICYELDISFATLQNWEQKYPKFLAATAHARELAQGWWEKKGRQGIDSKTFNAQAYSLQVRNRFPRHWRDKQDLALTDPDGGPLEINVVRKVVATLGEAPQPKRITAAKNGANGQS